MNYSPTFLNYSKACCCPRLNYSNRSLGYSSYSCFGKILVSVFLSCFAYATILGWSFYGLRCTQFVFGRKAAPVFFLLQTGAVVFGAVMKTPQVWRMAEILNGLMALPNLLTLIILSPELRTLTISYQSGVSIYNRR